MIEQDDFEAAIGALDELAAEEGRNLELELLQLKFAGFPMLIPCLGMGTPLTGFEQPHELEMWKSKLNQLLLLCLPELPDEIIQNIPSNRLWILAKPLVHRQTNAPLSHLRLPDSRVLDSTDSEDHPFV